MGDLHLFGASAGSAVEVVLIPATPAPPGNSFVISDFIVTGAQPSANSTFRMETSTDGFVGVIIEVARLELIPNGDAQSSYFSPIRVKQGQSVRVVGSQTTTGKMSALLLGQTQGVDIKNV